MNVKQDTKQNQVRSQSVLSATSIIVLSAVLAMLSGCAENKSDPTTEYKDIGPVVPPQVEQTRSQAILERLYVIAPERDVTAIEGEDFSFKVRAQLNLPVDSYELKISGLPADLGEAKVTPSPAEKNTYVVSLKTPRGFISGDRPIRTVPYKLEIANIRTSDPKVESLYKAGNLIQEFSFVVQRNAKTPQITKVTRVLAEVVQGEVMPFSIEVMDPASFEGNPPRVDIYFQGTNRSSEGYEANGATYVRVESLPKDLGGKLWRFDFIFDAKNNDVGAQLNEKGQRVEGATHLKTRMFAKVYGVGGGVSNDHMIKASIKFYRPQVAVLKSQTECEAFAEEKKAEELKAKAAAKAAAKEAAAAKKKSSKPAAKK